MEVGKKIQFKPRLSIAKIGKFRFWTGIGLGILSAIVFYLLTFYLLDSMKVIGVLLGSDLPAISTEVSFFEKPFLIATSLTVGVSIMIRHWFMQATFHFQQSRKKITLRLSNYSLFLYYLAFYVAAVFIRFYYLDADFGDSQQLISYNKFYFIIPLYLFFAAWTEVSRYFKTGNWIPYTFLISLFTIIILTFIDIKPQGFSEKAFQNYHYEELKYIDSEVEKAKSAYDISFSEETIRTLKQLRTKNALNQLEKVRLAFKTDGKVSLNTIILEKILIHNFKGFYKDRRQSYAYIFPFQVYEQLRKVDPKSHEAKELLNILAEFHELSMLSYETESKPTESTVYSNKQNILIYNFYDYKLNYRRMVNETAFFLSKMQKLDTYNHHSLFNAKPPFPPALPMYEAWIENNFPELKY